MTYPDSTLFPSSTTFTQSAPPEEGSAVTGSADLTIRQGDTVPGLALLITDVSGAPMDLTGASCLFVMRELNASVPAVKAAMAVVNAAGGGVTYGWAAGDTAVPGIYMAEVHVTLPDASTYTYPNDGYLTITVEENLDTPNQSLVSVGDAKEVLSIPANDRSQDARILRFIRGVQVVVEAQVGPVVRRTFDEWYDGGSPYIRLRHRPSYALGTTPVLNLIACSEYIGPIEWPLAVIPSPDMGSNYSCMLDKPTGTVVRRTAGGGVQAFMGGLQTVHVVTEAGQQQVPWNIYEGTLELVRLHYAETQELSLSPGVGGNDTEAQIVGFLVPGKVREMLAPMRKHPSIA